MRMQLENKIAVVTGASSGIGAEFSKALVQQGSTVYGLARRKERLDQLQNELGERFIPVQLDITRKDDLQQWVEDTFSDPHTPDILVNNAGLGLFGSVDELPLDHWETMMDTNLNGSFYITRLLVPMMKNREEGAHIVNIASVAGLMGNPNISGYNASKFGMRGFSEALMKELREYGIKVTCFYPGSIATEFFEHSGSGTHPNMMQGSDVADLLIYVLQTPYNFLIDEIVMRPLKPKPSQ